MTNPEVSMSLDDCVAEVLGLLTGLDLTYSPEFDRYRAIARALNRALRANALEQEWGYYSSVESLGAARAGEQEVRMRSSLRPRIINDDAVRLVNADGAPVVWAYFLPRDAVHKYIGRQGLWCSATHNTLQFSRPFTDGEDGLEIQVPAMREPRMFRLPEPPEDPNVDPESVPAHVRDQLVDFPYPDLIIGRAAWYYAQTDPVMQPRAQTLEGAYKDLMYQVMERDARNTDSPYSNEFFVPVQSGLHSQTFNHPHPHSDERR